MYRLARFTNLTRVASAHFETSRTTTPPSKWMGRALDRIENPLPHSDITNTKTEGEKGEQASKAGSDRCDDPRPNGREEVTAALVDAAAVLITDRGLGFSVREVASHAGVNHGLVHTYFGSKEGLVQAAFDELSRRTAAELRPDGFPPLDLAGYRDAEMVRAMARLVLDPPGDVRHGQHPISDSWRAAIARTNPDMSSDEIRVRVAVASAIAMSWALFADYLTSAVGLSEELRRQASDLIGSTVAEIGRIPNRESE